MNYSEAAYFDGDHCAHVAAWQDWQWQERRRREAIHKLYGDGAPRGRPVRGSAWF